MNARTLDARRDAAARAAQAVRDDARLRERAARRLGTGEKLRLSAEIIMAYVHVRRRISAGPLPELLAVLRGGVLDRGVPAALAAEDHVTAVRLGRATARTLRRLPGDTRCLTQSLVLTVLLARRGIGSTLRIAVLPGTAFAAHAWVEHGGVPVLTAEHVGFQELAAL